MKEASGVCTLFMAKSFGPLTSVRVVRRVPAGTVDTVLSYCHYSLNDQTLADMIPYLKEKGVGIINASALSMGLLTDQAGPILQSHPCSLCSTLLEVFCIIPAVMVYSLRR